MLNTDLIVGIFGLFVSALAYSLTRNLGMLGSIFVDYTLVALVFFSAMTTLKGIIKPEKLRFFESAVERNNVLAGLMILALYLFFMPRIGFLPASYLFYTVLSLYLCDDRFASKNLIQSVMLSGIVVTGFFLVFRKVLEVPLPAGTWFGA
jgi:hypothetical protein